MIGERDDASSRRFHQKMTDLLIFMPPDDVIDEEMVNIDENGDEKEEQSGRSRILIISEESLQKKRKSNECNDSTKNSDRDKNEKRQDWIAASRLDFIQFEPPYNSQILQ